MNRSAALVPRPLARLFWTGPRKENRDQHKFVLKWLPPLFVHGRSHRLRLGTRASWSTANVTFMFGLAGEYEFDGESDMIVANAPEGTSDIGGFSAFAETGLSMRPSASSPWQFEVHVRGWEGQRDAVSGMATVNYAFLSTRPS